MRNSERNELSSLDAAVEKGGSKESHIHSSCLMGVSHPEAQVQTVSFNLLLSSVVIQSHNIILRVPLVISYHVIKIIISEFLKRHSNAKRTRAPSYSRGCPKRGSW